MDEGMSFERKIYVDSVTTKSIIRFRFQSEVEYLLQHFFCLVLNVFWHRGHFNVTIVLFWWYHRSQCFLQPRLLVPSSLLTVLATVRIVCDWSTIFVVPGQSALGYSILIDDCFSLSFLPWRRQEAMQAGKVQSSHPWCPLLQPFNDVVFKALWVCPHPLGQKLGNLFHFSFFAAALLAVLSSHPWMLPPTFEWHHHSAWAAPWNLLDDPRS